MSLASDTSSLKVSLGGFHNYVDSYSMYHTILLLYGGPVLEKKYILRVSSLFNVIMELGEPYEEYATRPSNLILNPLFLSLVLLSFISW